MRMSAAEAQLGAVSAVCTSGGLAHHGWWHGSVGAIRPDGGIDALQERQAGRLGPVLRTICQNLLLQIGAVAPAGLVLGFCHVSTHLFWWTPSLSLTPPL